MDTIWLELISTFKQCTNKTEKEEIVNNIIERFNPLINKYAKKLSYNEASSDLIICLIKAIYKIPELDKDAKIVKYFSNSLYYGYIKLSKKYRNIIKNEVIVDFCDYKNDRDIIQSYDSIIDIKLDIEQSIAHLPKKERNIIQYKFFEQNTYTEIANKTNLTRPTIKKYEKKGLKLLRNELKCYYE